MPLYDVIEAAAEDSGSGSGGEFDPIELSLDEPSVHQSIGSAIYKHSFENGRRYHYFRNGKYPIPNDDLEQNREDRKHALVLELTDGKLIHAPIGTSPQKIIDLGTGTGIWAIEVGDKYPSAEVIGVDLSPIQPVWVPPNVKFIIDDVEDDWITTIGKYDYAHVRYLVPFIDKVPLFLSRCYENLKPGAWIESCDFGADASCDDATMPADWPVKVFWDRLAEAMRFHGGSGRDIRIAPRMGPVLEEVGFVNISVQVYKVPIGTWAADKTLRLVGMYMRQVIEDFLDAAAVKPYQALGMPDDEIAAFMDTVFDALHTRSVHCYGKYYVWTAQKPPDTEE